MPTLQARYEVNTQDVAAKVMDGEAILINISTGVYHSLDGVGGLVWELIGKGHSIEEMAAIVANDHQVTAPQAQADLQTLLTRLIEANLVRESDALSPASVELHPVDQPQPYEPPSLNSFSDMSELLALDPPMPGLEQIPWDKSA